MREALEVQGLWWLPRDPDRKVPGWFSYDPEEGGTLRLSGSLRPLEWVDQELEDGSRQRYVVRTTEDVIYPRIHGQAGRRIFNLEDSFRVSYETDLCREDDVAERVHVNWLLTGAWFEGADPIEMSSAVAEIQFLTSWIDNDALAFEQPDHAAKVYVTATVNRWATQPIDLGDGLTLQLTQKLGVDGDHREELSLQQRVVCDVRAAEQRSLDVFTTQVGFLQDLLTIAAGRTANIQDFYFTHVDVPMYVMSGEAIKGSREELRLYTRWANRDTNTEALSPYAMLFTFDEFGAGAGVGRWMTIAAKYRSELRRIMAARYNPTMFVEDRVSNSVAALESFDRTRRGDADGNTSLVERLRECVKFAGDPFPTLLGGETVSAWTERAKNHRHALGHHLDRFRENMSLVERELADQLMWLGQMCLLRAAGAPDPVFEKIANNSHIRWVEKRAAAAHPAHVPTE